MNIVIGDVPSLSDAFWTSEIKKALLETFPGCLTKMEMEETYNLKKGISIYTLLAR